MMATIAETAAEQQKAAERNEVAVEHPGEARLGEVQIPLDRPQGDGDDRAVIWIIIA
jgi:hypothetical protein